jgi:hypothetical protein
MRYIAIALAAVSIVGLNSVQGSAASRWVEWRDGFWMDMNSLTRDGQTVTFDVIQGTGDPVKIASDPDLHTKNRINCATQTHNVYSPVMDLWSGEGSVWDREDERMFKLACNRDLKR